MKQTAEPLKRFQYSMNVCMLGIFIYKNNSVEISTPFFNKGKKLCIVLGLKRELGSGQRGKCGGGTTTGSRTT